MGLHALGTVAVVIAAIMAPTLSMSTVGHALIPGSRVRLLDDQVSFRLAFSRFPNDKVNGLSPAKMDRLGQEAEIVHMYRDKTFSCRFDDGVLHDLPLEAIQSLYRDHEWIMIRTTRDVSCTDAILQCSKLQKMCDDAWVQQRCAKMCGVCLSSLAQGRVLNVYYTTGHQSVAANRVQLLNVGSWP